MLCHYEKIVVGFCHWTTELWTEQKTPIFHLFSFCVSKLFYFIKALVKLYSLGSSLGQLYVLASKCS